MTFNDQQDLLKFLTNVGEQLEILLSCSYQRADSRDGESRRFSIEHCQLLPNNVANQQLPLDVGQPNTFYVNPSNNWEVYDYSSHSTRTMYDLASLASYTSTDYYVPSTSTNLVNFTQYSAKLPQRQDTGYVYLNGMQPQHQQQAPPPPPLMTAILPQDYQPSNTPCAYCYWLATTSSAQTTAVPIVAEFANNSDGYSNITDCHSEQDYAYLI